MRASRALSRAVLAVGLLLAAAGPLRAGQDPFSDWTASGFLQVLEINRPTDGRPPTGILDAYGDGADGYTFDGLYARLISVGMSGPLGWAGARAVLGAQVSLGTASLTDLYLAWNGAAGEFRLGQVCLPFGVEQQASTKDLNGIQRSLLYGFEDYGHTHAWGLELMNQRGWGLRWDFSRRLGPLTGLAQAGVQDFNGGWLYQNALGGVGRLALDWRRGRFGARLGYSALLARGALLAPPATFTPLGAPQGGPLQAGGALAGHAAVAAWGPDARVDFGPLSGEAEMALQTLKGLPRGGGQVTVRLDLDSWLRDLRVAPGWRRAYLYAEWEQASSGFGDGVHQAGALYRATVYGLRLPLGWNPASLKLESLRVGSDSFGGTLPDGQIEQALLQIAL